MKKSINMYPINTSVHHPYKKNIHTSTKAANDTLVNDLICILKGARFYNHKIINNNLKLLANTIFSNTETTSYNEYTQQIEAKNENEQLVCENSYYEDRLNELKFIEKLPPNEYLLIIGFLYGNTNDHKNLLKSTGKTSEELYSCIAKLILKAHKNYFRNCLDYQ